MNRNLESQIEMFYKELKSLYSLNKFDNIGKITVNKYELHIIKPPLEIVVSTSLDEPYFSFGGDYGLLIYKKEDNLKEDKYYKHKIILILQIEDISISAMIYLGNRKLISGGEKGFNLIHFEEDYKSYNIIFHIMDNLKINDVIKGYNESFISYGDDIPIWKWKINKEENNIEKLFILNPSNKIINLCEISNKYFAYQTNYHVHIIDMKTFQQKIKIDYYISGANTNGIRRYSEDTIGLCSHDLNKIKFFSVETGEKLFEISDDRYTISSFLKTNRDKDENEIITISKYSSGRFPYGVSTDFSLHNNKWEKLTETSHTRLYLHDHIYEMNDKTILITAFNFLYILIYPSEIILK